MAQATDSQAEGTPARKLQRGFLNIALAPIEITQEAIVESKKQTVEPTWFLGMLRGSVYAVGRAAVGVYEILTFPFPLPAHYAPVIQPEFAYQHLEQAATPA